MEGGAKKIRKEPTKQRKSRKSKSKAKSKAQHRHLPKTGKVHSTVHPRRPHVHAHTHASESMSLTDLQFMAKSEGIPFGGLNKSALVRKINHYH